MENNKRPENMCRIATKEQAEAFIQEQVNEIKQQVGDFGERRRESPS